VLEEKLTTRLVLKSSTFPPTPETRGINISGYLCHARRSTVDQLDRWEDVSHFDLRSLGVGEHVRIHLGPSKFKAIFQTLLTQYRTLGGLAFVIDEMGLQIVDPDSVTVLEGTERKSTSCCLNRMKSSGITCLSWIPAMHLRPNCFTVAKKGVPRHLNNSRNTWIQEIGLKGSGKNFSNQTNGYLV